MQLEAPGFPARGGGEARGHHEGAPEIAASSLATGGDLLAGHGRRPPRGPRAETSSRATGGGGLAGHGLHPPPGPFPDLPLEAPRPSSSVQPQFPRSS